MEKSTRQLQKVAIITGGTSGLGLAMAKKFVEKEIMTIVTGRDESKLKETKESLGELCVPLKMDITELGRIPDYIKEISEKFGRIDILINNAGINLKKDLVSVTDEEFQRIL